MKPVLAIVAAGVVACAFAVPAAAQDLAKTAGKDAKVVLDNTRVRVIELNMAPGDRTGMHSHGDNIVVFVSGGEAEQTMADGTTKAMSRKPGEVVWSGPVTHDTLNKGKTPVRTLVIELKDNGK
ncbi:cytoplasmic protein [Lysobacter niastensis]|uniref:Cytoplasmic protein n=1 Tax=Lysobacter niastensis TaxID=380629 RepID=A0ABS0B676_9GAMM|nr:cytoplasmic protein [Lysobacter niastensis]MBF6023167.1 cytoplasmic protein [Lysobacter niastensis]